MGAKQRARRLAPRPDGSVNIVLVNCRMWTGDPERPEAEALAVAGDRIAAVGSNAEIRAHAGPETIEIDLDGRRVIPGLIDSHVHAVRAGLSWQDELHVSDVSSIGELLARVRAAAAEPTRTGWVTIVGGWHPDQLTERRGPTRDELDRAAPDVPVYVQQTSYVHAILNSAGLRRMGIDASAPDPSNGSFERDEATGEPTGVLRGKGAFNLCLDAIFGEDLESRVEQTIAMCRDLSALGVTGAIDMGGPRIDATSYRAIYEANRRQQLPVRFGLYLHPHSPDELAELRDLMHYLHPGMGDDMLRIIGVGEIPFVDCYDSAGLDNDFQMSQAAKDGLRVAVRELAESGWTVNMHAVRDETLQDILDVWEEVNASHRLNDLRFSISHADVASVESLRRVKAMDLAIIVEGRLIVRGSDSAEVWGTSAVEASPPLRDILDLDIRLGVGSDATVAAPHNPWVSLWWLVTGSTLVGTPQRLPRHRLSRAEALTAHTVGGAWFSFDEEVRGTLEVGKYADLVVLDRDFFTVSEGEIPKITSELTLVGGQVVHAGPGWPEAVGLPNR